MPIISTYVEDRMSTCVCVLYGRYVCICQCISMTCMYAYVLYACVCTVHMCILKYIRMYVCMYVRT